jgi:hypothetical protein
VVPNGGRGPVDANGQISGLIELPDSPAKKCSGRSIPIHPDLAVIASERGGWMRSLSIVVWFNRVL